MNGDFYFYDAPNGVRLIKNRRLDAFENITHAFTTRRGGVSTGECESLNLSWKRRDSQENVWENHCRMAQAMGVDVENIVFVQLTHSDRVLCVDKGFRNGGRGWSDIPVGYDAVITNDTDTVLLARTADCGTVLMHDPVKQVIAAVHSGWKGTTAGVIVNAVQTMKEKYGCAAENITAVCGPSICPECFLVHDDRAQVFFAAFGKGKYDRLMPDGRYSIDLWRIMEDQLLSCGIKPENISAAHCCTCCDEDNFFSHRRGRGRSGIMLAVIDMRGAEEKSKK